MSEQKLAGLLLKAFGRDKIARMHVEGNMVEVKWGDWSLRVYFEAGPHVGTESQEIIAADGSQRADAERLASCNKRIEIASDSDYGMDHFNDFVFLLQAFEEELPGSVMFVPEEGTFFEVGEFN